MLKYKQGPMMLNYIAGDHEIVRGRPFECDITSNEPTTNASKWYIRSSAGEKYEIPDSQVTLGEDGHSAHISLTKYDTRGLLEDSTAWICAGEAELGEYQVISLAGLELRYWELADAMPDWKQNEFRAFSYALHMAIYRIFQYTDHFFIWAYIDGLEDAALNGMALELQAPFYDEFLPLETKREIVKNALLWHEKAGTVAAVKNLIRVAYGNGEIEEWPEFGGDPYTFRFITDEPNQDPEIFKHFNELIRNVKNVRSHLCEIKFIREEDRSLHIGVGHFQKTETALTDSGLPNPERVINNDVFIGSAISAIALSEISDSGIQRDPKIIDIGTYASAGIAEVNTAYIQDAGLPQKALDISFNEHIGAATELIIETISTDKGIPDSAWSYAYIGAATASIPEILSTDNGIRIPIHPSGVRRIGAATASVVTTLITDGGVRIPSHPSGRKYIGVSTQQVTTTVISDAA